MGDDDLPFGRGTTDLYEDIDRQKGRHRITIALVALVLLAALLGGAYAAGSYWADRTYYLAEADDGTVEINQGQPGGFLIFDPTLERSSTLPVADLDPARRADVVDHKEFTSLDDANTWLNTQEEIQRDEDQATPSTEAPTTTGEPGSSTTTGSTPGTAPRATTSERQTPSSGG